MRVHSPELGRVHKKRKREERAEGSSTRHRGKRNLGAGEHRALAALQRQSEYTDALACVHGPALQVFYADRLIRLVVEAGLGLLPFQEHHVTTPTGERLVQCCLYGGGAGLSHAARPWARLWPWQELVFMLCRS